MLHISPYLDITNMATASNISSTTPPVFKRRTTIACRICRKRKVKVCTCSVKSLGSTYIQTSQCVNTRMERCQNCTAQNLICKYEKATKIPPQRPVPSTTTPNIGGFGGVSALAVQDTRNALPNAGVPRGPGCG